MDQLRRATMPMEIHEDKIIMRAGEYKLPKPWVGLTRDEILQARWHNKSSYKFARVLEAKLKERNL